MVAPFEVALRHAAADLDALGLSWALIGGVAISVRSAPRFTKDVDFVIAVADDPAAESVVHQLSSRGYSPLEVMEQEYIERLSGVRLGSATTPVVVDLLFASSGIEDEIVTAATEMEVLPDLHVPVASTGHLMALKVLAGRNQDLTDLAALITTATDADVADARRAVALIRERGFNRDQDVVSDLEQALTESQC